MADYGRQHVPRYHDGQVPGYPAPQQFNYEPHAHYPSVPHAGPELGPGGPGQGPPGGLSQMYVAPPAIEMQPWARNVWRWLAKHTTGVARVDLRRPTAPPPEQYQGGNLLVVRSRHRLPPGQRHANKGRPGYNTPLYPNVPYPGTPLAPVLEDRTMPTGARIKITRSFLIGGFRRTNGDSSDNTSSSSEEEHRHHHQHHNDSKGSYTSSPSPIPTPATPTTTPYTHSNDTHHNKATHGDAHAATANGGAGGRCGSEAGEGPQAGGGGLGSRLRRNIRVGSSPHLGRSWEELPLLDIGVGVNLDMDQQQVQPVARIKVKDLISIKAFPFGMVKLSRTIPLGPVALKVRYELPLAHARNFWEPPARLLVRLDGARGTGVHLTPGGLEFDEQVLRFGENVSLRASAALSFPRQLPIDWDAVGEDKPLRLKVNRLSLKSIW